MVDQAASTGVSEAFIARIKSMPLLAHIEVHHTYGALLCLRNGYSRLTHSDTLMIYYDHAASLTSRTAAAYKSNYSWR